VFRRGVTLRDISDLAGCRAVVAVQERVWGAGSEIVPASVLLVSVKRGGILIGAFSDQELAGFVWSLPGVKDGALTHWSHMLGILPSFRGQRLGVALKLAQRDRALTQGIDLIEWTFDPLQAPNAHLNFSVLGATASTYLIDVYGDMAGPLHRGTATDRLIAEWRLRESHAERRLTGRTSSEPFVARTAELIEAQPVIDTESAGEWTVAVGADLTVTDRRVLVPIPSRFTEMQSQALDRALAWRSTTRRVFTTYFSRGYRAVDFYLNREQGAGVYVLSRS
jgi:predicted GNAT superfamily acetyltransferase